MENSAISRFGMENSMDKIMELYKKYKDIIMYIIFGALTTLVNFCSFFILTKLHLFGAELDTVVNTTIAWFLSVAFAYVTNRKYVFESKSKSIFKEISSFFGSRVLTLILEMVIMYIFVTALNFNVYLFTIISQVLVIVLNYVFSKLFVFKK